MATLAELTEQLAALKLARNSGVLTVRHGDVQTTFRSLDEMERTIAAIVSEINGLGGKTRGPKYIRQNTRG
ncbi:MAG: hypothetical protein WD627_13460 [Actinomycetota bacterium]